MFVQIRTAIVSHCIRSTTTVVRLDVVMLLAMFSETSKYLRIF